MKKQSFLRGAAILAVAGLFVKLLGATFRIPLANFIGDVGMANYTPAYAVYNFFLVLATAGIPVAISKMVSERVSFQKYQEAHRVFRVSGYLMMSMGAVAFLIVFFGAGAIAENLNMPDSQLAMRSIAPALLFVPLMASYRGYFQGMQEMAPTALSQVIEQVFRVLLGLTLAYGMYRGTVQFVGQEGFAPEAKGAAGATLGAAAGAVGGLAVMLLIYMWKKRAIKSRVEAERYRGRHRRFVKEPAMDILKQVAVIAVPITIGAAIMPIVSMIDAGLVNNRLLDSGMDGEQAKALYGQLTGLAGPLINFPQVLTQAVAMSLVPLVAAAYKHKEMTYLRENVTTGLRTSVLLGLPCAVGLFALAEPILLLLYPNQPAAAKSAAPCLMVLAIGVVFLSSVQTLTGVLQGIGKQMIPVRNLAIGVAVKIALTWGLTAIPSINVLGAATGTIAAYLVAAILNIMAVQRYTGTKFDLIKLGVKPIVCSLVMGVCAWGGYQLAAGLLRGSRLAVLSAIFLAILVYVVMVFITKTITQEELAKMPGGKKLVKIMDKFVK